jgi:hypothetical protein
MNKSNYRWTRFKRRWIVFWGNMSNTARNDLRIKRPAKVSAEEEQAMRIWTRVVHQRESDLMYNPQTHDAYAQWDSPSGTVYLFLESGNMRVINTVVGYDIRLSSAVEQWCGSLFAREVAKRRARFRCHAESKVLHSLDSLESRLEAINLGGVSETQNK